MIFFFLGGRRTWKLHFDIHVCVPSLVPKYKTIIQLKRFSIIETPHYTTNCIIIFQYLFNWKKEISWHSLKWKLCSDRNVGTNLLSWLWLAVVCILANQVNNFNCIFRAHTLQNILSIAWTGSMPVQTNPCWEKVMASFLLWCHIGHTCTEFRKC